MTPQTFLTKWRNIELKERTASQSHFNDLCALLGLADPITADPKGEWFTFEKGASKTSGGEGWADVWRKGCFAWEYKGPRKDLDKAFSQLLQYSVALENPPLLIVSDMDRIRIHTNWTNTVQEIHEFSLEDLLDGAAREKLKRAFTDPDEFKPTKTRQALTEETAREFAGLAQRLRDRGHEPTQVAHFVNQLVFCMFAEDVGLLPDNLFTKMLDLCRSDPRSFAEHAGTLFGAMANQGGKVGFTRIDWFNGGLFQDDHALPVTRDDVEDLYKAAQRDWSQIDPSILGTLFERGLDPAKRSQLGAHYTDRDKIMMIVKPVIIDPLEAEWAEALGKMRALIESAPKRTAERLLSPAEKRKAEKLIDEAAAIHSGFIERLTRFRVLDPACGSGNFLYVALRSLKDIEHRANLDAEALGLPRGFPRVGPECVLGIELNPYAAELARVSVWIGEIQWMRRNGFDAAKNPILRNLDTIECRDAVLAWVDNTDQQKSSPFTGRWQSAGLTEGGPDPHGANAAQDGGEDSDQQKSSPFTGRWQSAGLTEGGPDPHGANAAQDGGEDSDQQKSSPFTGRWQSAGLTEGGPDPHGANADRESVPAPPPPLRGPPPRERGGFSPTRAEWPDADVVVGNPPFLGGSIMISGRPATKNADAKEGLGEAYTFALRETWSELPGSIDLVCYWFAKAWAMMESGKLIRAGLVATNSIRGGTNREILNAIVAKGRIFNAWNDEGWTVDGAAVRVSLICFDRTSEGEAFLNGTSVSRISADLSSIENGIDLTKAASFTSNGNVALRGTQKGGSFDLPAEVAREFILLPTNVNGRKNQEVVLRRVTGADLSRRPEDRWIIDFGHDMTEDNAAYFEAPFGYVVQNVKPSRDKNRREWRRKHYWLHSETSPGLREAIVPLSRYIGTPRVSKYRLFSWLPTSASLDDGAIAIARDDDTSFGILHSKFHELWSLRMGTSLEDRPRYTPSTTFETFPFPQGLTPDIPAADYADDPRSLAIAAAAARLNELRENWLNPPDLVVRVPEVVPGYPDRILPRDEEAAKLLAKRTLTNLYNARPAWLDHAHRALDEAWQRPTAGAMTGALAC